MRSCWGPACCRCLRLCLSHALRAVACCIVLVGSLRCGGSLSHAIHCIGVLSRRGWGRFSFALALSARHMSMPRSHAAVGRVRGTHDLLSGLGSAVALLLPPVICFLHVLFASRGLPSLLGSGCHLRCVVSNNYSVFVVA